MKEDIKVKKFINEKLRLKNEAPIITILEHLMSEYYVSFTPPKKKPNLPLEEWDSKLLNLFTSDTFLLNVIEEEMSLEPITPGRLLLYIDFNYISGEVYNGRKK